MTEAQEGFWWRKGMVEDGFITPIQLGKRYDPIPADPDSPKTLFISPRHRQLIDLVDGSRMPMNKYLGNLLREYMLLIAEALRLHNNKIDNIKFPLPTPTGDGGVSI